MKNKIELEKVDNYSYSIVAPNGKRFGSIHLQDSGHYAFDGMESWVLREIADRLEEVNRPFNDSIDKYFAEEKLKNK